MPRHRRQPDWWRQVAYSGTKLLYQPEPQPIVYIFTVRNILGRLALHGTIPYDWRQLQGSHNPRGVCYRQGTPGSGSKSLSHRPKKAIVRAIFLACGRRRCSAIGQPMPAFERGRASALHGAVGRQASGASTRGATTRKAIESMHQPAQNDPIDS